MKVRGHTLVWHSQLPGWVSGLAAADLRTAMNNHITQVMTHDKGEIHSWDVVTRPSRTAAAAPGAARPSRTAKLCHNDYNTDCVNAKSAAVANMVKHFKARGVPIDCVGRGRRSVDVQITELDIEGSGTAQATSYSNVVKACLAVSEYLSVTPHTVMPVQRAATTPGRPPARPH